MTSAFQFINEKQSPDKSKPSPLTGSNNKPEENDGIRVYATPAANATPATDKNKTSPFATEAAALNSRSDKHIHSPFAFVNQPVANSVSDKDKKVSPFSPAANSGFGFGAAAGKPVSTQPPVSPGFGGFGAPANKPVSTQPAGFGGFGAPANKPVSTQPVEIPSFGLVAPLNKLGPTQPANTGFGGFGSLAKKQHHHQQQPSLTRPSFGGFGQAKPPNSSNARVEGSFENLVNKRNNQSREATGKEMPVASPTRTLSSQSVKPSATSFGAKPSQPQQSRPFAYLSSFGRIRQQQLISRQKTASTSQQHQQAVTPIPSSNAPSAAAAAKASTSPQQSSPSSNITANTSSLSFNSTASTPTTTLTAKATVPVKTNFSSSFIMEDMVGGKSQASSVAAPAPSSTTAAAATGSYVFLLEEIADEASDQPQKSQSVPAASPTSNEAMTDRLFSSENNLNQQGSAFPFINGGSKSVVAGKPPFKFKLADEPPQTSAFSFINQAPTLPTLSGSFDFSAASINLSDMFIFGSPTTTTPPETFSSSIIHTEKDSETKLLGANTSWRTFQYNKQKEFDTIRGLYYKESQTQDMIKQLKDKLAQIDTEKTAAIASEDYKQACKLATQHASMQCSLQTLQDVNLRMLQTNICASWQRMAALLEKESTLAERVVESTTQVKQDTHRYLVRLEEDHERLHRVKVQNLEKQRADVDKLKSEVAFDHDMIKQNETDLYERMDEAVLEETEKLTQLESRSKTLQLEIESLRQKLNELESEEKTVDSEMHRVKSIVETKLKPFEVEQKELTDEKASVEQRQIEIKEIESKLDKEDANMDTDMTRIRQVKERGEKEVSDFDKRIEYLTSRQDKSKTECNQLNALITKKKQGLEATVTQHKQQIQESRATIARKNNEIKSIQNKLYQDEQSRINLDESISKITAQTKSLTRRKQLALQNGHFTSAEALSLQIKELEVSLLQSQEEYDRMGDATPNTKKLDQEKENLSVLEKVLVDLERTCGSELKTVLESLKEELEKSLQLCQQPSTEDDDNDMLKSLIECELTFVQSKLNSGDAKQDLLSYF